MRKHIELKILGTILLLNSTILTAMIDVTVPDDTRNSVFLRKVDASIKMQMQTKTIKDLMVHASPQIDSFLSEALENNTFPSSAELDTALTEAVKVEDVYLVRVFFQEFLGKAWPMQPSQQAVIDALTQARTKMQEMNDTKKRNSRLNWAGKPDKNGYTAMDRLAYYPAQFDKTLPERIESLNSIIEFLETKIQH